MTVPDSTRDDAAGTARPPGWALVVDDHPLFCDALELTLRSVAAFTDVTVAGSLGQALDRLDAAPAPALVLLDLSLPDVSGLDGLIKLKRHLKEDAPVVIVSSMIDNSLFPTLLPPAHRATSPSTAIVPSSRTPSAPSRRARSIRPPGTSSRTPRSARTPPSRASPRFAHEPAGAHPRPDLRGQAEQADRLRSLHRGDDRDGHHAQARRPEPDAGRPRGPRGALRRYLATPGTISLT